MANRKNAQGIRTSLTPAELRRVIALEKAYTAEVQANPIVWLPDDQIKQPEDGRGKDERKARKSPPRS